MTLRASGERKCVFICLSDEGEGSSRLHLRGVSVLQRELLQLPNLTGIASGVSEARRRRQRHVAVNLRVKARGERTALFPGRIQAI